MANARFSDLCLLHENEEKTAAQQYIGGDRVTHHLVGMDGEQTAYSFLSLSSGVVHLHRRMQFTGINPKIHHQSALQIMHHLHCTYECNDVGTEEREYIATLNARAHKSE